MHTLNELITNHCSAEEIFSRLEGDWDNLAGVAYKLVWCGRPDVALQLIRWGAPAYSALAEARRSCPKLVPAIHEARTFFEVARYRADPKIWNQQRDTHLFGMLAAGTKAEYVEEWLAILGYGADIPALAGAAETRFPPRTASGG